MSILRRIHLTILIFIIFLNLDCNIYFIKLVVKFNNNLFIELQFNFSIISSVLNLTIIKLFITFLTQFMPSFCILFIFLILVHIIVNNN